MNDCFLNSHFRLGYRNRVSEDDRLEPWEKQSQDLRLNSEQLGRKHSQYQLTQQFIKREASQDIKSRTKLKFTLLDANFTGRKPQTSRSFHHRRSLMHEDRPLKPFAINEIIVGSKADIPQARLQQRKFTNTITNIRKFKTQRTHNPENQKNPAMLQPFSPKSREKELTSSLKTYFQFNQFFEIDRLPVNPISHKKPYLPCKQSKILAVGFKKFRIAQMAQQKQLLPTQNQRLANLIYLEADG